MNVGLTYTVYILQAVSVDRISAHSPFWYSTRGWYFILSFPGKFFVWEKLACCSNFWLSGDGISPAAALSLSRWRVREILFPTQPTPCLGKATLYTGQCLTQPFAVQHSGPFPTWNKRVERLREYSSLYWLKIVIFYMLQLYMKVGLIFTVYILQAVSVDRIKILFFRKMKRNPSRRCGV